MKKMMGMVAVLLLIMVQNGHAKKSVTAVKDPDAPSAAYEKITINVQSPNYRVKQLAEGEFKKALEGKFFVDVIESTSLYLPTRSYSEDEVRSIAEQNGVQAMLNVGSAKLEITKAKIAAGTASAEEPAQKKDEKNPLFVVEASLSFTGCLYEAKLADVKSGKTVWYASIEKCAFDNGDVKSLMRSVAREISKSDLVNNERRSPVRSKENHISQPKDTAGDDQESQ